MSRTPPREQRLASQLAGTGRKPRSSDCARCLVLRGLREAGLPSATIGSLCEQLWLTRAKKRQLLFLEGNRATHLFVLRSGRVKLSRHDSAGTEHIVEILESGDVFGAEAVFDLPYGVSAEAMNDVEVCVGTRREVEALLEVAPSFGMSLARYLLRRLNDVRARQACLGTVGARARLAAWLLHETKRRGPDAQTTPHDLTLAEYGAILGTSPETVCRALKDLRQRGIVELRDGALRILDEGRLRRLART
jgi:CRP/FNR family transcriptional regulator